MMLALLIYRYANGLFSSRRIERPPHCDVAVRYLCAGTHPDHDTICKFRRDHLKSFRESFLDVLELARELKRLKLDNVSLDGNHIKANASIGQQVSRSAGDCAELEKGVASIPTEPGKPKSVLTDAGYVNGDAFERLQQEGVEIYCSVDREDARHERHYDFRPEKAGGRAVKEPAGERLVAMRDKQRTGEGKALYGRRNHTVEPVFGIIKEAMGFRGFSLRGKEKVSGEWTLVCLAYHLRRLDGMIGGTKNGGGRLNPPPRASNPIPNLQVSACLGKITRAIYQQLHRLTIGSTANFALAPPGS